MIRSEKLDNSIELISFEGIDKLNAPVAEEAKELISRFFDTPSARVIIDLGNIKYIDSSGFGCLLSAMKASRNNYGIIKIFSPDPDIMALFRSLQLHTVFELYDNLESCISSF